MTKLLQNKSLIKFLGIALSILLVVALIPQIGIAYGSKDDVVGETPMAETGEGDEATDEGEEAATDSEEAATSEEGTEPTEGEDAVEGEVSVVDGVEMVSHKVEIPGEEDEGTTENAIAPQSSEDEGTEALATQKIVLEKRLTGNVGHTIEANEEVTNTSSPLTFSGNKTYTLTVEGTLKSDILITGGAQVTIKGSGTIKGTGKGSVITVEGAGSELILGGIVEGEKIVTGPTITNGIGTKFSAQENKRVGGGVFVKRTDTSSYNHAASFWMKAGTIYDNTAQAGGGIYVDAACGFTMDGGTVDKNTAEDSEGGGIFVTSANDHEFGSYAKINAGNITNNKTETTFAWGGGGVFVNSGGALNISDASIDHNTAEGLGGGVSGCPHASIAVTTVTNGAAVFQNEAKGTQFPTNGRLRLLDTDSVIQGNEGKRVAAGDFLFDGLYKTAELTTSWKDEIEGRWSGFNASEKSSSIFAQYGNYGKRAGIAQYAQDFYCTRASYIAPTNLGDENGVAWRGLEIGIPAVNAKETVLSKNINTRVVEILVANKENTAKKLTSYASLDATLGLTSEAKEDPYAGTRKVNISGNYSATHGGGVASNGALEFGSYDWSDDSFEQSYELVLNKEIFNDLGMEIGKNGDGTKSFNKDERFTFILVEEDGTEHRAVNAADGTISFPGLPGLGKDDFNSKTSVEKPVTFKLTEEQVDGYDELSEMTVEVTLIGTRKVSKFLTASNSMHTSTVYETAVKEGSVKINSEVTNTVRNTLKLETSVELPVTKIAYGIHEGTFTFDLNEIEDPTVKNGNDLSLKEDISLAHLAAGANHQTESIDLNEWQTEQDTETKWFNLGSFTEPGEHWYAIAEEPSENEVEEGVSYDKTTYLVRVVVTLSEDGRTLDKQLTKWEVEPGSTDLKQVDPDVAVSFENVGMKYAGFNLDLNKRILTTLGGDIPLNGRTFNFALYDGAKEVATGATDGNGAVSLAIDDNLASGDESYAKQVYAADENMTFTFTLKETVPEETDGSYVTTIPDATVEVELSAAGERTEVDGHTMFLVTPTVESVKVNGTDVEVEDKAITVTNRYTPHGEWQFQVDKYFYGLGDPRDCSFTMQEIERAPQAGEPLANVLVANDNLQKWTASAAAADFQNNKAAVVFDPIEYQVTVPKGAEVDQNIPTAGDARGDHYYLITEDGDDATKDTTAYVVKVTVAVDKDDPGKLVATETVLGYADDLNSTLNPMPEGETPAFYNTDTQHMISAASYSVYAASGEPVDQVCYVDPKIIKNLEGRAIKSGEFAFKLIEVANYNDTEGTVISATTNDEFGMVDFDKANNVSGDLENPSCLAYTKPGTYYYRVIEDTSKGGMNDQSVLYSDQVITFTTVIEQDEATGRLVCTDMYYGYWDKAANKNVRYDEQYTDFDTQPGNIGDMSKLNPDWHPTITNKTRPMDIQVRKTSVSDRTEGLVGATYALYMVNENAQGDIKLAEATSEDGGWITYKNVSLSTNNLYYFKETAAPAGHTVSEFRSSYFYLVEDASSANGYTLQYTDSKYLPEAAADDAAVQAEVAGTVQAKNAPAAQADTEAANEAAADTETQPGYSADGNVLLTYDKDGGVYDEVTTLEVNKLDTRTHEWVEGAKLVILEKESGKEIASWTSGKAPQKLEKTLNVGTTYLLREVEAPNQYRLANDVEFVIDDYGNVSITKGTENGNAELSDNTISLYDTMLDAEETETIEREKSTTEKPNKDTLLAKTGAICCRFWALRWWPWRL